MMLCLFLKLTILAAGLVFAGVALWQLFDGHPIGAALWLFCAHAAVNGVAYNKPRGS